MAEDGLQGRDRWVGELLATRHGHLAASPTLQSALSSQYYS